MNILPHKSWHVRTKKNIERVRRDEEKAAEEEKEKQRKIALAEQEARTDLLRLRARGKYPEDHKDSQSESLVKDDNNSLELKSQASASSAVVRSGSVSIPGLGNKSEHINFFQDIEDGLTKQGKNKDHEAEKKQEQEDLEKKLGLLTYLGQTALDEKKSAPWYLKKSKERKRKRSDTESNSDEDKDLETKLRLSVQDKRRESLDPLLQMKEMLHKKKKKHSHKKSKHKDKKHSKESKSIKKVPSSTSSSSSKKTIEQMRAERLARERGEKQRTLALVNKGKAGLSGIKVVDSSSESDDEKETRNLGKRKYNSQYNPEFVNVSKSRRNQKDSFF